MGLTNENVGPKILAKIKIYVLTRAELLFQVCYEIPCISFSDRAGNHVIIKTLLNTDMLLEMIIFVALKRKKISSSSRTSSYYIFSAPQKVGNGMCLRKLIVMLQSQCKL